MKDENRHHVVVDQGKMAVNDKLLSLVLPAFNEEAGVRETYRRLMMFRDTLAGKGLDLEIIFVNDGSKDQTGEILDSICEGDPRVRVLHFTRNFGHQAAITAGLVHARGEAVAIMDCDLQDPPEVLLDFVGKWVEGFQVVYGVRKKRKEWIGKRFAYWLFYRLMAAMSDIPIPLDSGDFSLLDRSAVDLLNSLPEQQRFVRGLRTWIGLKQVGVEYERAKRYAGMPAYTLKALFKLAADGLVGFSSLPLRLMLRLGLLGMLGAILLGIWVIRGWAFDSKTPRGWASLACLVLMASSIQLFALGIIGEYLSRIFLEVKGRPAYLIARIVQAPKEGRTVQIPHP